MSTPPQNEVIIGDCADVLKQFDDESIDLVVTDPPYGYNFMNLSWDKALPSLDALKECCRVLKAGAFGFFMCAPRQDVLSRMIVRLEDAGFNVGFSSIFWVQSQGFPKSQNMSKAIDKRFGVEPIKLGTKYDLLGHGSKPGTVGDKHEGYQRPWNANPDSLAYFVTSPSSDQAKQFEGSYAGFQPKPATEIIIVCMKPLSEKTYLDQALKNGHGISWLSDCRIPCETPHHDESGRPSGNGFTKQGGSVYHSDTNGRFPANLLVSDDVLDRGIITISRDGGKCGNKPPQPMSWDKDNIPRIRKAPNDSGDFSRYFSLDAWWDHKIQELPEHIQKTFPFLIVPKPSKSEKNKYIENKHPTVKPLKLMSYLITMGSREGDVILDPFAGSGTTLEACRLLNRQFIGIDKDPANEPLMRARGQVDSLESY